MDYCKYWFFNFDKMQEECKLTGENLETCYLCDFEFEKCPAYQKVNSVADYEKLSPLEKLALAK